MARTRKPSPLKAAIIKAASELFFEKGFSKTTSSELCKKLEQSPGFLRCHRSYLINMDYVQSLSYQSITMDCGTEIPLPRGKYAEVKEAYLEYAFQNRKVTL